MVIGEVQGRQLIGRPLSMLLTGGCGYGDLRFNQLSTSGAVIWRSDRSSAQVTAPVRPQILREQTCMIKEKGDGLQHWDT